MTDADNAHTQSPARRHAADLMDAMFRSTGPTKVADRTWFATAFAGVCAFETDEGLVLVDTGPEFRSGLLAERLREETDAPVHTAIYTHGHVDHAYGLAAFLAPGQEPPTVIAHSAMPARFERYARTAAHNAAVNARQFGGAVDAAQPVKFGPPAMLPDTFYEDRLDIEVGGVTFQLHHGQGETDDVTWVYCPERRVLCPGDLIIWAVPNAGNPQKVQRYPWAWAEALREMAALEPTSLAPGHGPPIVDDPDTVNALLTETAEFLETLVERTLEAMNQSSPPHVDIVHAVEIPVSDSPWLHPVYDEGEFIVRNIIRWFGGWYTGRPSELKPAPRADVASEIALLAGGTEALVSRAEALAESGRFRIASHLADYALEADPTDEAIAARVADLYDARSEGESSLMATNLFRSAATYARQGRPYA